MTAQKALFIQGTGGTPSYSAINDRMQNAAVIGGRNFENIAPGTGAIGRGHGTLTPSAMAVTANGTPNNTVKVAAGTAAIRGTQANNQGVYIVANDAEVSLTVSAAHATLTRTDYVVARIRDNAYGVSGDDWVLEVLAGTAGGAAPTVPEDTLVLAQLNVDPGGSTVIDSSDITDLRPHARSPGGVTPVSTASAFPNPQPFDMIWDMSDSFLKIRNAANSAWLNLGADLDTGWQDYTPGLAGALLGTGGTKYGMYRDFGSTIVLNAGFGMGTGSSVVGEIKIGLPVNAEFSGHGATAGFMGGARVTTNSGTYYASVGMIHPSDPAVIGGFATAGTGFWGIGVPVAWADGFFFNCFCTYHKA